MRGKATIEVSTFGRPFLYFLGLNLEFYDKFCLKTQSAFGGRLFGL
jgi:hypothetical protein